MKYHFSTTGRRYHRWRCRISDEKMDDAMGTHTIFQDSAECSPHASWIIRNNLQFTIKSVNDHYTADILTYSNCMSFILLWTKNPASHGEVHSTIFTSPVNLSKMYISPSALGGSLLRGNTASRPSGSSATGPLVSRAL